MWAQAVYHLRLSSEEFWALTPRLFHVLWDQHREALVHAELLHAWTTEAVINHSMVRPEEWTPALNFMPNHEGFAKLRRKQVAELSPEQEQARSALEAKVLTLAAEMKLGRGLMLERVSRGERV